MPHPFLNQIGSNRKKKSINWLQAFSFEATNQLDSKRLDVFYISLRLYIFISSIEIIVEIFL